MTKRVTTQLTERLGVGTTWASMGRIAAWALAWTLLLSFAVRPFLPDPLAREIPLDEPASTVEYLGPMSRQDFAGFAPATVDDDAFTVAWIGGSEIKLNAVSVVGEVSNRVTSFGSQRVDFDAYTLIAPRPIDTLRAIDEAVASGADALVITLNTAWVSDEWSMRDWPNLDVANLSTLWGDPALVPWAASLTSPADPAWRLARAVSPVVEAQLRLNTTVSSWRDRLSFVAEPPELDGDVDPTPEPDDGIDPRIPPDPADFWIVQQFGQAGIADFPTRVATLVSGLDDDRPTAEFFARQILERAQAAGVPVLLYPTPINPAEIDSPVFAPASEAIEQFWRRQAAATDDPLVEFEWRLLSRDLPADVPYFDLVHMVDAGPMADLLVPRLCDNWRRAHPDRECR